MISPLMSHSKEHKGCTYICLLQHTHKNTKTKLIYETAHTFLFSKLTIEIAISAIEMNVKAINVFTAYIFCTKDFCKQKV